MNSLLAIVMAASCAFPMVLGRITASLGLSIAWSGMLTATHESLCSGLAAYVLWITARHVRGWSWLKLLAASMVAVSVGDLSYGIMAYLVRIPPPRGHTPLIHEIPYVLFCGILTISVVSRGLEGCSRRTRPVLALALTGVSSLYFLCSRQLILVPFFNQPIPRPWTVHTTAVLYALFQSAAVGGLLLASLRALSWAEFIIWSLFLTLNASDFVLRYQDMGHPIDGLSFSEYGWEFALAGVATTLLLIRNRSGKGEGGLITPGAPLFSLRVLIASTALAGLLCFVLATWWLSAYLGVATPGTAGSYVLSFVLIWSGSNGISILISRGLLGIRGRLAARGDSGSEVRSSMAWEVREIFHLLDERNSALAAERDHTLRITSTVAHDIRSPLTALRVAIPKLETSIGVDCGCRGRSSTALESLQLSLKLIQNTANAVLAERKRILQVETLGQAVNGAIKMARLSHPGAAIEVHRKGPTIEDAPVPGMTSILNNLITNAVEATRSARPVRVVISRTAQVQTVEVSDHGDGMSAEMVARLMRGEVLTTKSRGNGLGVSSAVQWARDRGYRLKIASRPNTGTSVKVEIPL